MSTVDIFLPKYGQLYPSMPVEIFKKETAHSIVAMQIHRGYKFELKLNNKERSYLRACAGTARFAWNWGLAERLKKLTEKAPHDRFTTAIEQHRVLNKLKKTELGWLYQYSKCIPQESLRDLERAFTHFWENWKERKAGQTTRYVGFPKFKKKGKCKASFRLTGTLKVIPEKNQVQLPRLGKLRVKERPRLPETALILSATVSRTAARWYVALTVVEDVPTSQKNVGPLLALDKGVRVFGALSLGLPIPNPHFLQSQARKLRRMSKALSRKKKGSKNRQKAARKLADFYLKITAARRDFLHKTSTYFTKTHGVILVEDLFIKGLMQNKKLSKYWAELAHGEFQRMLDYKAQLCGAKVIKVDRFFPSSKLCSNCLYYNPEFTLSERVFHCPLCGLELDRDYNASLNLENYYYIYQPILDPQAVAQSSEETLNACGAPVRLTIGKLGSRKQEDCTVVPNS
ncbi:MAG: RNA-guided endonuclease InsQ/TnpB family protein [Promethearchaeota archaeon]